MNYPQTAQKIIAHIGGKENILSLFHCITRLRFLLHDHDKVDRAASPEIFTPMTPSSASSAARSTLSWS